MVRHPVSVEVNKVTNTVSDLFPGIDPKTVTKAIALKSRQVT